MQIIHFTEAATDRLGGWYMGIRSLPLADGGGNTHVTCFHLPRGKKGFAPPVTHDTALLVVSGRADIIFHDSGHTWLRSGIGVIIDAGVRYSIESPSGAVIIAIESTRLKPTARAVSTPERIMGQLWPGEPVATKCEGSPKST